MRTALYTVALGAALLLTASTAGGGGSPDRDCTADVRSMCAGIARGGRIRACIQRTSAISRWLLASCRRRHGSAECKGTSSTSAPPPRTATFRLHETASRRGQRPCRGAIAFMASPAADRFQLSHMLREADRRKALSPKSSSALVHSAGGSPID